jgi:hypothetical protein
VAEIEMNGDPVQARNIWRVVPWLLVVSSCVMEATDRPRVDGQPDHMKQIVTKTAATILDALAVAGAGMAPHPID